jgi:hypothetical protein
LKTENERTEGEYVRERPVGMRERGELLTRMLDLEKKIRENLRLRREERARARKELDALKEAALEREDPEARGAFLVQIVQREGELREATSAVGSAVRSSTRAIAALKDASVAGVEKVPIRVYRETDWKAQKVRVFAADDGRLIDEEPLPKGAQATIPGAGAPPPSTPAIVKAAARPRVEAPAKRKLLRAPDELERLILATLTDEGACEGYLFATLQASHELRIEHAGQGPCAPDKAIRMALGRLKVAGRVLGPVGGWRKR